MAVPAEWRLAFGHPFSQMAAHFPQIGGFFRQISKFSCQNVWFFRQSGVLFGRKLGKLISYARV